MATTNRLLLLVVFWAGFILSCARAGYVTVSPGGRGFELDRQPFFVAGFNYFEGPWLAMADNRGGNRTRLAQELKHLKSLGVTALRVMAGALGPDYAPYRWKPSFFPSPYAIEEDVFQGLDFFLSSLEQHQLKAIVVLSDFWQASGGFAQLVQWADNSTIPYAPSFPQFQGSWDAFIEYASRFYNDSRIVSKCQAVFKWQVNKVVRRLNTVTRQRYFSDSAVLAWEIANEPQRPPSWWIDDIGKLLKTLDKNHLVTSGLEGKEDDRCATFNRVHSSHFVDFATVHLWVENWGVYKPYNMTRANLDNALDYASEFIANRTTCAQKSFKKPIVLEEFGMARDGTLHLPWFMQTKANRFSPLAPTTNRDIYFAHVCNQTLQATRTGGMAGMMLWAWSGEGRPLDPGPRRIGDPPHETPGWYSIYNRDTATLNILASCFKSLAEAAAQKSRPHN